MPTVIDLSTLTAAQGFIIQGDAAGDLTGGSVSNAGDVNGDGIDDYIIGAILNDVGASNSGAAYVVYGRNGARGTLDLSNLTVSEGFRIVGDIANDLLGRSVSAAGDVNNDGIGDLIVGTNRGDDGGTDAGESYVIYGQSGSTRGTLDLTNLTDNDGFAIQGDTIDDYSGYSVSAAGDINNDGIDDVIIGAWGGDNGGSYAGQAYVIYGQTGTRGRLDLTNLTSTDGFIIQGDAAGDYAGFSISGTGDVNGDGIDDIIIGAKNGDNGGNNAGEAYVIYGRAGARGTLDLTNLTSTEGYIIQGDDPNETAGHSVSGAGDINGDGINDLLVGAILGTDAGVQAGQVYVIYGRAGTTRTTIDTTTLATSDGFVIQANGDYDNVGASVSAAGDVNGDGIGDIIVGGPRGYDGGIYAGEAYVIFGQSGSTRGRINLATLADADGFIIQGDAERDFAGGSVSGAGDVNDDGVDDLIVGAGGGDDGGANAGEAYIIYGKRASPFSEGNDIVVNTATNDAFDGAGGFDQLDMSTFTGPVTLNTATGTVASTEGGTDTVTNIEFFTLGSGDDIVTFGNSGFVVRTGLGNDRVTGGTGRDLISGGDGDDILAGGSGAANELGGGAGNDIYVLSAVGDSVFEALNQGNDEIQTTLSVLTNKANVETLRFTDNGAHVGVGLDQNDIIIGGTGVDQLFGRGGDDILRGGTGAANALFGQAGDDTYYIDALGDSAIEGVGEGTDSVFTGLSAHTLRINVENLTYTGTGNFTGIGNASANAVTGGDGDDFLSGLGGDDVIVGGLGSDILQGGDGADEFEMSFGDLRGVDRILDFVSGQDILSFNNRIVDQSQNFVLVQGAGPQVATTFDATFLYNSSNGRVSYDIDGAGETAAVVYAILNAGLTLVAEDFIIY